MTTIESETTAGHLRTRTVENHDESQPLVLSRRHCDDENPPPSSPLNYRTDPHPHLCMASNGSTVGSNESHLVSNLQGRALLLAVAFLYGSLNVSLRLVYQRPGPPSASALSSSRGWLAVACFIPLLMKHTPASVYNDTAADLTTSTPRPSFWRVAGELAIFNFGAQGLLTLGLLSTASARASFFTQTSVVMTPVLSALAGYRLHWRVWMGCVIALVGLVLLSEAHGTHDSTTTTAFTTTTTTTTLGFGIGDLFCLSGAFCWSFYLFRLSSIGSSFDEIQMQAAKTLLMAILYSTWFLVAQLSTQTSLWPGWKDVSSWLLIFYSALGPGTLADIIQQKGQAIVWAAEANVILSLEPVFTAILGLVFLGESTTLQEKIGGGLIVFASIMSTSTS